MRRLYTPFRTYFFDGATFWRRPRFCRSGGGFRTGVSPLRASGQTSTVPNRQNFPPPLRLRRLRDCGGLAAALLGPAWPDPTAADAEAFGEALAGLVDGEGSGGVDYRGYGQLVLTMHRSEASLLAAVQGGDWGVAAFFRPPEARATGCGLRIGRRCSGCWRPWAATAAIRCAAASWRRWRRRCGGCRSDKALPRRLRPPQRLRRLFGTFVLGLGGGRVRRGPVGWRCFSLPTAISTWTGGGAIIRRCGFRCPAVTLRWCCTATASSAPAPSPSRLPVALLSAVGPCTPEPSAATGSWFSSVAATAATACPTVPRPGDWPCCRRCWP
jgi:hypothetical protein